MDPLTPAEEHAAFTARAAGMTAEDLAAAGDADLIDAALTAAYGLGVNEGWVEHQIHVNPVHRALDVALDVRAWARRTRRDVDSLWDGFGSCGTTRTARAIHDVRVRARALWP